MGVARYYFPLVDSSDPVEQVAAWCALLSHEQVPIEQYDKVVEASRYEAVRSRAFRFFEGNWEHELAARVLDRTALGESEANTRAMRADLACDNLAGAAAQRDVFLATGRIEPLLLRVTKTEQASGWRAALPLAVQTLRVAPHDGAAAEALLHLLYTARHQQLLSAAVALLADAGLHPWLARLFDAAGSLMAAAPEECLRKLQTLGSIPAPRPNVVAKLRNLPLQLEAEAREKQGDFRAAHATYCQLNVAEKTSHNLGDFGTVIRRAGALDVPPLPADKRANHFIMTGFPRSGTTLLENALAMHPSIETFEEVPARANMQLFLDQRLGKVRGEAAQRELFVSARDRYYDELDRRSRKTGASVFIDKMPMRSAEARFMAKAFPDKRYIFSIRHPFDVVLSCFKQNFGLNIAMEHFRRFETAVALYDFTMREWFGVFSMDDPRIHYLRYDDLVTDFNARIRGALSFLDVGWDEAVADFAQGASNRSARTPSYQKVRQGLSIGIQSSWRNYAFLFRSDEAKPLYHWAEFFGYPTD